jgi:hypothetical protein
MISPFSTKRYHQHEYSTFQSDRHYATKHVVMIVPASCTASKLATGVIAPVRPT